MHLYIHIPYCISKCDYCDFFSIPLLKKDSKLENVFIPWDYIASLKNEIKYKISEYDIHSLSTVYIGGGTPSLLLPEQIKEIFDVIKNECSIEKDSEITIEMNPETVTREKLIACRENGINRISLGIQSLSNNSLEGVHRHCNSEKAVAALDLIKKEWDGTFSVDVISGLPGTDDEIFESSIRKLIEYNPEHFSMYSLCIEQDTPLGKRIKKHEEEIMDVADRQWLRGREILKENGYIQYEVSNFARKGFEAKHNSAYWKQEDYIGCGSGACQTLYTFGPSGKGIRSTNTQNINQYIEFWKDNSLKDFENIPCTEERLTVRTEEYEFFMMGLRMLSGIDEQTYAERYSSISEWNGDLERRLGVKEGIWHKYRKNNYVKVYKNIHNKKVYALNEEGILFLTPLLESLL